MTKLIVPETELQSSLIQALLSDNHAGIANFALPLGKHTLDQGFAAYSNNVRASAANALAAALPTVKLLLGEAWFKHCAIQFWQAHPPAHGVWNCWGAGFAAWFEQANLEDTATDYPYIADCARLDWFMHSAELAADKAPQPGTWALMSSQPPDAVRLVLHPSVTVFSSDYAVADIWVAHQTAEPAPMPSNIGTPQTVLVWREGWRARCKRVTASDAAFTQACVLSASIAAAFDSAVNTTGAEFEFDAWLTDMVAREALVLVAPILVTSVN